MGTIAEKLSYLADTKDLFKDRLNSLGAEIIENTTFRNYLNWLDEFYGDVSNKIDLSENGIVGRTSQDGDPTPDYPLEINNLSGDVEYKVSGKNLFNKNNANILKGWFRDATDEMVLNSVSTDRIIAFEGKPNTTYTISKKISNRFRVDLYNSLLSQDGTYTFNYPIIKNDSGTNITVTTTATDYYIYIHVYQSSDGDFQAILNSIQIEYGNSASSYEPYISESFPLSLGDIELCNISDYKDRIYSQNGEFYLEKKTDKVVLDGSRNWTKSGNTNIDRFVLSGYVDYGDTNCFSNYFENETYSDSNYNKSKIFLNTYSNTKRLIINFNTVGTTSLSNFKTWLSTHNTVVYYVLATPTTTEITEENYPTLYSQLQAIQEFLTKYKINKEFLLDYSSPEIEY